MARDRGAGALTALRIGLTGPIGCGKSTVGGWLEARGAVLIDADAVAREVTAPGQPAHDEILAGFGEDVRAPDGSLDRAALAAIVFADAGRLRELEAIVHPAVRPAILDRVVAADRGGTSVVVIEAIRLVDAGLAALCDDVWLVTCDGAEQRARLAARGMPPDDAERRIRAQADLVSRAAAVATRRIDTSGAPEDARMIVERALDDLLQSTSRRMNDPR